MWSIARAVAFGAAFGLFFAVVGLIMDDRLLLNVETISRQVKDAIGGAVLFAFVAWVHNAARRHREF